MKTEVKDILHLYLGCDVAHQIADDIVVIGKLRGVTESEVEPGRFVAIADVVFSEWYVEEVKPILRKLSDMTEEEAREFCRMEGWGKNLENVVVLDGAIEFIVRHSGGTSQCISRFTRCRPEMFIWLLSKGFDLFGLIDSGLAIDKKTL